MAFCVETTLTAGHLTFTNLDLSQYTGDAVISRSSYSVAGQRIAVKVAGDPVSGNNGLFFVYTDHLGSSSILSDLTGTAVALEFEAPGAATAVGVGVETKLTAGHLTFTNLELSQYTGDGRY